MAIRTIQTRRRKVDEALAWSGTAVAAATVLGLGAVAVLGTAVQQVVLRPDPPPRVVAEGSTLDRLVRVGQSSDAAPTGLVPGTVLEPAPDRDRSGGAPSPAPSTPPSGGGGPVVPPPPPPPGPGPSPQPPGGGSQGPGSAVVDPLVRDVTGIVDQATGQATAPVTGPVRQVVDGVTDTVDDLVGGVEGLLGGLLGGGAQDADDRPAPGPGRGGGQSRASAPSQQR